MLDVRCCVLFFIIFLTLSDAAKILCVFQSPFISHQIAFRSLTQELLRHGHEIVVVTTDPAYPKDQTPKNMTEVDLHDVSYNIWTKQFVEDKTDKKDTIYSQLKSGLELTVDILVDQFSSDELVPYIKGANNSFDLVLAEASFPPSLFFSHLYKIPFMEISTLGIQPCAYDFMGIPRHLFYPETMRDRAYNISILEAYEQTYYDFVINDLFATNEKIMHERIVQKFVPDLPNFDELKNNVNMLLANIHPVWEGIRPYPLNYIATHDFVNKQEQEIPKNFQSYLDNARNGVIYASFGTSSILSTLPEDTITSIFRAFSKLPYDILLKSDKDELPGRPDNVKLFRWLPQRSILRHPKIKLFITQGGQHSIDEAIKAGVPLIVISHIFDQFANAERCVHHGIGAKIDLKRITEQKILDTVAMVVEDGRYRENIRKLRSILQDNPMKPMDHLIWAIEYVIRHGGAMHMRSPSANISWTEFFELEILFYFVAFILFTLLIIAKLILILKRLVFGQFSVKNNRKFD